MSQAIFRNYTQSLIVYTVMTATQFKISQLQPTINGTI